MDQIHGYTMRRKSCAIFDAIIKHRQKKGAELPNSSLDPLTSLTLYLILFVEKQSDTNGNLKLDHVLLHLRNEYEIGCSQIREKPPVMHARSLSTKLPQIVDGQIGIRIMMMSAQKPAAPVSK
jgi:hypothetical protein